MPPKSTVSLLSAAKFATGASSRKSLPCPFRGCENQTAMALLLTTDEEAKINCQSCCLFGDPSAMKKSESMVCRATRRTSKRRSNYTRKRKSTLMRSSHSGDGRRGNALIASTNRQSRQRDLLAKVFASDHKHCYDT